MRRFLLPALLALALIGCIEGAADFFDPAAAVTPIVAEATWSQYAVENGVRKRGGDETAMMRLAGSTYRMDDGGDLELRFYPLQANAYIAEVGSPDFNFYGVVKVFDDGRRVVAYADSTGHDCTRIPADLLERFGLTNRPNSAVKCTAAGGEGLAAYFRHVIDNGPREIAEWKVE